MNDIIKKYNELVKINNVVTQQLELEARVCFAGNNTKKLISNINVYEFKTILEQLKKTDTNYQQYFETITCFNSGIRKIYKSHDYYIYQRKSNVLNIITDTFYSKYLKIKWSLNIEETTTEIDNDEIMYIRKKNVHVFNIIPNWKIYLINARSQQFKTFEIEIERENGLLLSYQEMTNVVKWIEKLFINRPEKIIIHKFQSLLNTTYWLVNKPINLKYDMWTQMDQYNYFLKYDGERFLMFKCDNKLYAINETNIRLELNYLEDISENTILDCEYMSKDSTYIIFDILIYNGKDVRKQSFTERRQILEKMKLDCNTFQLCTLYKSFDNLWSLVSNLPEECDGIIFVPKNIEYKNKCTYKYKPAHLLTIDFLIKNDQLFVESPSGSILFQGNKNHPYDETAKFICKFDYQPFDIIEFQYDSHLQQFIGLRQRVDKLKSNYITVALDVWFDIHSEINIISFVQNIFI